MLSLNDAFLSVRADVEDGKSIGEAIDFLPSSVLRSQVTGYVIDAKRRVGPHALDVVAEAHRLATEDGRA